MMGVTGFGQQTRDLFVRLARQPEYEIIHLAWNYHGAILDRVEINDGPTLPFTILPANPQSPYAQDRLQEYIRKYKPDMVWILLDSFMLHGNPRNPQACWITGIDFSPAKFVMYYPSDGGTEAAGFPCGCENVLKKTHTSVAMARFGQIQVKNEFDYDAEHIPHGVDTNIFKPLPNKEEWKAKFGCAGKFVVGIVARNQPRKNMSDLAEAFAKFAKDKPDVVLLLHSDPLDPAAINDLPKVFEQFGVAHKVRWTNMKWYQGFSVAEMNELFNAMDVFFLPTSGEGFGVPTIEAMACGVPCVVTNYTTTKELLIDNGQCGLPIKVIRDFIGSWNVPRAFIDVDDAAKQLTRYYEDRTLLEQHSKTAIEKVAKIYDFEVVTKQWDKLLKRILS